MVCCGRMAIPHVLTHVLLILSKAATLPHARPQALTASIFQLALEPLLAVATGAREYDVVAREHLSATKGWDLAAALEPETLR